jgi:hypothetical protein
LRNFDPDPLVAESLLSSLTSTIELDRGVVAELWHIIDYSWLASSDRPITTEGSLTPSFDMDQWSLSPNFETNVESDFETARMYQFPKPHDASGENDVSYGSHAILGEGVRTAMDYDMGDGINYHVDPDLMLDLGFPRG